MQKLDRTTLHSLEEYAAMRDDFRRQVMEHKRPRRIALNEHAALYFEDFLTMKYQVQEMLRAERIFEPEGIAEEIEAYNPLIPDGTNWKATFMLEYPDPEVRREQLGRLIGVEDAVFVQVGEEPRVFAIADEDLERNTEEKTSSVHFMRFELSMAMVRLAQEGAPIQVGVNHEHMHSVVLLDEASRASLAGDLDPLH